MTFGCSAEIVAATAWILESVREARIKRPGECAARTVASCEPSESGETPVMRTMNLH